MDKPNCEQHKKEVAGISDMKELANLIGDLHYEKLRDFMYFLHLKLQDDSMKDSVGGRDELSKSLGYASGDCFNAYKMISNAWQISKQFMKGSERTSE